MKTNKEDDFMDKERQLLRLMSNKKKNDSGNEFGIPYFQFYDFEIELGLNRKEYEKLLMNFKIYVLLTKLKHYDRITEEKQWRI